MSTLEFQVIHTVWIWLGWKFIRQCVDFCVASQKVELVFPRRKCFQFGASKFWHLYVSWYSIWLVVTNARALVVLVVVPLGLSVYRILCFRFRYFMYSISVLVLLYHLSINKAVEIKKKIWYNSKTTNFSTHWFFLADLIPSLEWIWISCAMTILYSLKVALLCVFYAYCKAKLRFTEKKHPRKTHTSCLTCHGHAPTQKLEQPLLLVCHHM